MTLLKPQTKIEKPKPRMKITSAMMELAREHDRVWDQCAIVLSKAYQTASSFEEWSKTVKRAVKENKKLFDKWSRIRRKLDMERFKEAYGESLEIVKRKAFVKGCGLVGRGIVTFRYKSGKSSLFYMENPGYDEFLC